MGLRQAMSAGFASSCRRRALGAGVLFVLSVQLLAGAGAATAQMRDIGDCKAVPAVSACEAGRGACDQECRARLFAVDPARTRCVAVCDERLRDCRRVAALPPNATACR